MVALSKIRRPIWTCFRPYLLHTYRAQCSNIERVFLGQERIQVEETEHYLLKNMKRQTDPYDKPMRK